MLNKILRLGKEMWYLQINVGIDELEFLNKTIKVAKFIGKFKIHSSIK